MSLHLMSDKSALSDLELQLLGEWAVVLHHLQLNLFETMSCCPTSSLHSGSAALWGLLRYCIHNHSHSKVLSESVFELIWKGPQLTQPFDLLPGFYQYALAFFHCIQERCSMLISHSV